MQYLSPFYYYANGRPLANGTQWQHLAVLVVVSLVLIETAVAGFHRRDLRG